jgi:hypothetical protein
VVYGKDARCGSHAWRIISSSLAVSQCGLCLWRKVPTLPGWLNLAHTARSAILPKTADCYPAAAMQTDI